MKIALILTWSLISVSALAQRKCVSYQDARYWISIFEDNPSECVTRKRKTVNRRDNQLPHLFTLDLELARKESEYWGSIMILKFFQDANDSLDLVTYRGWHWSSEVEFSLTFDSSMVVGNYYWYFSKPRPSLLKVEYEYLEGRSSPHKFKTRFYTSCDVLDYRPNE